jgi:5-methylcytosine-specific restriction endonuclease McrA
VAAALNQAWKRSGNAGVKISAADLASLWLNEGGRCRYCDIEVDLMTVSFDHIDPLVKGGVNAVGNLAPCCMTCQRSKYTKTPEELEKWKNLTRRCLIDGKRFKPRWADYIRGYGFYCSRRCAGYAATKTRMEQRIEG